MIKHALIILILSVISVGISAQSSDSTRYEGSSISKQLRKMHWNMNMGTAYSFIPGYGGGMNYFAAPGFTYPINNRVSIHGGLLTGMGTRSLPVYSELSNMGNRYGYTSLYGSVSYQLNQHMIVYGSGIKNIASYGLPSPFFNTSFDEISIGSSIRLGKSVTIGASVHFREYGMPVNTLSSPLFRRY